MKKTIFTLLILLFLVSCGANKNNIDMNTVNENIKVQEKSDIQGNEISREDEKFQLIKKQYKKEKAKLKGDTVGLEKLNQRFTERFNLDYDEKNIGLYQDIQILEGNLQASNRLNNNSGSIDNVTEEYSDTITKKLKDKKELYEKNKKQYVDEMISKIM